MDAKLYIERLYEDESVASYLDDTAAVPLLKWAEGQIARMAGAAQDEARFERDFSALKKMLKRIGRYIDRRGEWTEAEQAAELEVIRADAKWLATPLTLTTPADYLNKPGVEVVLAMIGGGDSVPSTDKAPPALPVDEVPAAPVPDAGAQAITDPFAVDDAPPADAPTPKPDGEGADNKPDNTLGNFFKRIFEE